MEQNAFSSITEFDESEKYWLDKLSGELKETRLPADFFNSEPYTPTDYPMSFENQTLFSEKLINVSKGNHLSLYVLLLTTIKILVHKWTHSNDVIIGSPIYTKSPRDYFKFVAFRDNVDQDITFKELLFKVKETVSEGYKHQCFPARNALKILEIENDFSLYRVAIIMENIHQKEYLQEISTHGENDIAFIFRQDETRINGTITYDFNRFSPETIWGFCQAFALIIDQALDFTGIKIADICITSRQERERILFEFNNSSIPYASNETVIDLFNRQVERTPDNTAIVVVPGDEKGDYTMPISSLTYRDLQHRVNQLAASLLEKNIGKGSIVALTIENSLEMAIGILGVLAAGAAYLPLDPASPIERKRYIFEISRAEALLYQAHLTGEKKINPGLDSGSLIAIEVDAKKPGLNKNILAKNNDSPQPHDLAYVIFTSGTTGRPKGVLVEHKGLVNYTLWRKNTYQINESDVTLQLLTYCFDGFGSNFYSSLLSGGTLVMVPDTLRLDFDYIKGLMTRFQVTNISLVPGIFKMLLDRAQSQELEKLRFVVLAGERSSTALVNTCREKIPHLLLINEYGPTEATVTATCHLGIKDTNTAIIGKPIANTFLYILDSGKQPVPVNVTGELFISGVGIARGYLDNPELTDKKFFNNPWVPGERMYRTGDMARWLPDGTIEFDGRLDSQVKIRGNRIEPDEIVHHLLKNEAIKEAVVIPWDTHPAHWKKNKASEDTHYLCAYVVADKPLTVSELREFLALHLPEYMIPTSFVQVDKIPLTPNGKIDKKTLAKYKTTLETGAEYVPPVTQLEKEVANIWKEILNQDKVGVKDNFFDLGGNSARVIQVNSRLKELLARDIPIITMFEYPSIESFLKYLEQNNNGCFPVDINDFDSTQEHNIDMMTQTLQILEDDSDGKS